jgi:2-octaprenyl-6-methoxyphenol hydroxylase
MQNHSSDILIVGGGTVGLSLAIDLLQSTDLTVAIVEAHSMDPDTSSHPSLDSRCLALANSSYEYLTELLGQTSLLNDCPIEHIQVSDRGFMGKCFLHAEEVQAQQLGAVIPIQAIGNALFVHFQQLQKQSPKRALWFSPNSVERIERDQKSVMASLDDRQTLTAKLVIFADGGRSETKKSLGFELTTKQYSQIAIIANVVCDKAHQNWAFERFTEFGPLALLPLNSSAFGQADTCGVFSLVWTVDADNTANLQRLINDDNYFLSQLSDCAGVRHGMFIQTSQRTHYPLQLSYVHQVAAHRSIAIGNAAQALHPIAGQGFNLGLRDVKALTNLIVQTQMKTLSRSASGESIVELGDWSFSHQYQCCRNPDRDLIINSTDALVHCFSNHFGPLVLGRNVGLLLMNKLAPIKHYFARRAMGY